MELWVRSQDKMNLVKVRQVGVNYQDSKQIIANYAPELYENSGEYYELLGTYETKERALEVLDEIQNFMRDYACAKKINRLGGEINMIPKPILIYNMPKK